MTTRDEAVAAIAAKFGDEEDSIYEAIENTLAAAGYEPLFEVIVDAIPPWVLAQLAIDRGGLEPYGAYGSDDRALYRFPTEDGGP